MASTLLTGLTDLFKAQVLGPLAAQSGESETSVLRGFEVGSGSIITGLASKLGQPGFGKQIFDMIKSPANDPAILNNPKSLLAPAAGSPVTSLASNLLSTVFGGQQSALSDVIGRVAGLRGGTVSSLLTMGAPLLLGMLGNRVKEGGLDAGGLTHFLSQEAGSVRGMLPPEVAGLLGATAATKADPGFVPPVATVVTKEKSRGWLWPLILALLILGALLWWFTRSKSTPETAETATTATTATEAPAAAPAADANYVTRKLPDNVPLKIPPDRMEDHLLAFIQDPSKPVNKTTWFDFDRLLFDTGSATLQPSSQEQLKNVANILQAYPKVSVRVGGYTDNTGDAKTNKKLSKERAAAVKDQLVAMGISADRLSSEGYGEDHPIADNSTEEGRQKNRRISLRVTAK